ITTLYDVLGVAPDAPPERIRAAYRERARLHHPDHRAGRRDGVMADLNEAYRVLGDPGRRLQYDRSIGRRGAAAHGSAAGRPRDGAVEHDLVERISTSIPTPSRLMPAGPARVPWKMMIVIAVAGSLVILVASLFNDPPSEEVPDGILRTGSCVAMESNGDVREVRCTGDDDIVVEYLIPTDASCPGGLGAFRDRLGLGTVCIKLN
ncbi:MAG: J domain-containing protein, partial [Ilumatobacteraceae bacterium]